MARLNVYVMWFLPAVLLWMCIDVEVKANNQTKVCRLNRSDHKYNSLWRPFHESLVDLDNELNGSRPYPLNESDIWKFCKKDLRGSRKKMQQYEHLSKFSAALSIVRDKYGKKIGNLANISWTLIDLLKSSIWTPDNCTKNVSLSESCKTNLTAANNDDQQKEIVKTLIELAMGLKQDAVNPGKGKKVKGRAKQEGSSKKKTTKK